MIHNDLKGIVEFHATGQTQTVTGVEGSKVDLVKTTCVVSVSLMCTCGVEDYCCSVSVPQDQRRSKVNRCLSKCQRTCMFVKFCFIMTKFVTDPQQQGGIG